MIDKEWERIEECFKEYLSDSNFDEENQPIISLSSLTKPILFKLDNLDSS